MGARDTALTPVSETSLAAASHLLNTPDLRTPSDAAFTATLSSGAHAIGRRALTLDNSTGHLGKRERWFPPPRGEDVSSLSQTFAVVLGVSNWKKDLFLFFLW